MDADNHSFVTQLLIWAIPTIPAVTVHECAHGWVALCFGDTSARDRGRLSLNPIRHMDLIGTLIIPGIMLMTRMPFIFGWAKPVPVDFDRLSHKRLGTICVALSGPFANLLMLLGWLALASFLMVSVPDILPNSFAGMCYLVALSGAGINLVFILFNLIPIPPLDGGRIVSALLPDALARPYMRIEPYGILILLILISTGAFDFAANELLDFLSSRFAI